MYERGIVGSKYEQVKDMDIKDIAKLVRKDLKEYFKDRNYKISVRIDRYSMGQSLNVYLSNTEIERHTHTESDVKDAVRRIVSQYNFDHSSPMEDYYHVNFSSSVRIED